METSEIINMIEKLSKGNAELNEYECLIAVLANLSLTDLRSVVRKCDVITLFSQMNLHERSHTEIALRLANTLFSVVSVTELMEHHQDEILQALQSNREELLAFVLGKLGDGIQNVKNINCLPDIILRVVTELCANENLGVSKHALRFLSAVALYVPGGVEVLFGPNFVTYLKSSCTKSEYLLRIVEMAVELILINPSYFGIIERSGLFQTVLDGLLDCDILTSLNFVQIAKSIVRVPEGYDWLEKHAVLDKLLYRLFELQQDPMGNLILPGYLTFFSSVVRQHPSIWLRDDISGKQRNIVSVLAQAAVSGDPVIVLAALESVAHIAGTIDGRVALKKFLTPGGSLFFMLIKLGRFIKDCAANVCIRALECLSELLISPVTSVVDSIDALEQARITLDWIASVGQMGESDAVNFVSTDAKIRSTGRAVKRLLTLATNPYSDIRLAALRAICSFATQPWGVCLLIDQPGCMEYLLNRNTETGLSDAAQLIQTKYSIVKTILFTTDMYKGYDQPECSILLRPDQVACLKVYIKEGVWGMQPSQATLAMEPC